MSPIVGVIASAVGGFFAGAKEVATSKEALKENLGSGTSILSYGVASGATAVAAQSSSAEELIVSGFMYALSLALFFYRKKSGTDA